MAFKENKWYNLGDVNPRTEGGIFVRRIGNEIEVVSTDVNPDNDMVNYGFDQKRKGTNYIVNARSDYVDYLKSRFDTFKQDPDKKCENNGVGHFADWKRFITLETEGLDFDEIVFYLAADMISYYGGDAEPDCGSNYWDILAIHDITPKNWK